MFSPVPSQSAGAMPTTTFNSVLPALGPAFRNQQLRIAFQEQAFGKGRLGSGAVLRTAPSISTADGFEQLNGNLHGRHPVSPQRWLRASRTALTGLPGRQMMAPKAVPAPESRVEAIEEQDSHRRRRTGHR